MWSTFLCAPSEHWPNLCLTSGLCAMHFPPQFLCALHLDVSTYRESVKDAWEGSICVQASVWKYSKLPSQSGEAGDELGGLRH